MIDDLRGFALPFRIGPRGGVAVETGPEKIRDNIVHILLTGLGERVMRRDYGAGLRHLLHDPINDALVAVVQHQLLKSIAQAEPRVEVTGARVQVYRPGSGEAMADVGTLGGEIAGDALIAEVEFTIRSTGQPVSLSVPVGLGGV